MCEHGLTARSPKLQCDISLHAWPGYEYQMETNFAYAKHIGSMTDNFWQHILDISKFGEIVFEEDRIIEAPLFPTRHVNKKMKSQLFKIARNFLVYSNEEYNDGVDCEDPFDGFGILRVSWPITVQIEELLQKIYEIFIRCHQINYMLYRQQYILTHSKKM
ncbi:MAG: hypothetical protein LLF76_10960 [Planctomycetaceae bacterium]|nr:hypothetical protein [Planctomycetaceae bacterium]